MATNKTDRAFKTLINKRTTSEDKRSFEEFGDRTINVHGSEIWADDIAENDPPQAVIDGAAELRTLFELTRDTTVGDDQSWYAEDTGVRLKDWISDKYGADYTVHLFDGSNNEIFPTDASEWFFDYQTGILTFSGDATGFDTPFKVTGYRYIGTKGAGGGGVTGPGSSTDHALARYHGTAGDTLLNSGVTLSDSSAMVFPTGGSISKPGTGSDSEAFGAGASTSANNTLAVGYGVVINNAPGSVAIGNTLNLPNATGSSVVVGVSSSPGANSFNSTIVGYSVSVPAACPGIVGIGSIAYAKARYAVSIGYAARVHGAGALDSEGAIAIGQGAAVYEVTSGDNKGAIAIGRTSAVGDATPGAGCNASVAIGENSNVAPNATNATVIGASAGASAVAISGVALGYFAKSRGNRGVVVGAEAVADSSQSAAIGAEADVGSGCSGGIAIGYRATIADTCAAGIAIGRNTDLVFANDSVAIGESATVNAIDCIAVGRSATVHPVSSGDSAGSVCLGAGANVGNATPGAGCNSAIALGQGAIIGVGAADSLAIGPAASVAASATNGIAVGAGASAANFENISIGHDCTVSSNRSIGIGGGVQSTGDSSVALGHGADSTANQTLAIGRNSLSTQSNALAIGPLAKVYNVSSGDSFGAIAVGYQAYIGNSTPGAGCDSAIALGYQAVVSPGHQNAVAIGASAASTASNRVTFAGALEVEIGQGLGVWGVTPPGSQPAKISDPTGGGTVDT